MQTKIIRSLGSVLRVLWPGEVMTNYLDVHKSVIISSPAGSGKTEKLAQRFIALLKAGVSVERILAVTFTEKAAAEMKQRILKTLKEEDEKLFKKLLEKMSLMRVSTIHSFCGTLLRRFSFEASIDANYRIEDAIDSRIVWEKILYEILMEVGMNRFRGGEEKDGHELLLKSLSEKGFRGLEYLKTTVNNLFEKNPFSLDAEIIHQPSLASHFSLVEELKNWPGARDTIKDYDKFFENGSFEILTLSEKYFLTAAKELRKRPAGSLKHIADYPLWAAKMFLYWKHKNIEECTERAERIRTIFKKCFNKYNEKKALKGVLDFSDLEYIAFRLLADNPEWANILYAFDEKTDHILVDEFQDTNSFQWAIIDRLTEEWRSGMGAKREEGITPTIFLVGDEKQSIYFFRGANVEIFRKARKKLQEWLADEFIYEEVKENFRSRPAIINFTNHVFQKIMIAEENAPSWITQYRPFEARRKDSVDTGRVEIILLNDEAWPVGETKKNEADIIAKRIRSLIGNYQITDRPSSQQRPCTYMDVALLLRKRTHLKKYEEAFRNHGIPFVVVKGIGFYQEPEIAILRALVYFLSNPHDDYNLYILLKSPFFSFKENVIIKATGFEGDSLFSKLKKSGLAEKTVVTLEELLSQSSYTPLGELIEKSLVQTGAWEYFYEAQRRANVKKFVRIVEDMERNGKSLIKVRDFLERIYGRDDEPKANVNTEGMDAVKIMTIHASKGLEFPLVFVPGLEEKFTLKTNDSLIYESDGKFFFKYRPESAIRRLDEDFLVNQQKEEEEQKRLFYVAVTRAEEALFLVGRWSENNNGFLGFLKQGIGLQRIEEKTINAAASNALTRCEHICWEVETQLQGLSILSEEDVNAMNEGASKPAQHRGPVAIPAEVISLNIKEEPQWKAVTDATNIRRRHGKDWVILGDIMHRLFEGISKGVIAGHDIKKKAGALFACERIVGEERERLFSIIEKDISLLRERGIWNDIILPRENSYSELPFILEYENVIYSGRIDRVIKEDNIYNIYDYKTFPVDEKEIEYLLKEYSFQLGIYKKAVIKLFNAKKVGSFIVFSNRGEVREVAC